MIRILNCCFEEVLFSAQSEGYTTFAQQWGYATFCAISNLWYF